MAGVNKTILVGRLGSDPEMKHLTSGAKVCNVSLATSEKWQGTNGEANEHTEWHSLVLWDKRAEILCEYANKGSQLYVEGTLRTRSYTDSSGVGRSTTELHVKEFQLLGSKADA